jgi:hypothetical protein
VGDVEGADGADADRKGYGSQTRLSIIDSAAFKERMTVNGHDVAKLYVDTIDLASAGHMAYRMVHVYPQGRQADRQGDRDHLLGPDVRRRGDAAGAGKLDRRSQARRHQALSRKSSSKHDVAAARAGSARDQKREATKVAGDQIKPVTRRDVLKAGGALTAAGAAGLYAPAVIGQSKPLDGVTLNVSCWSAP